jgi:hypothetical protein
MFHEIDSKKFDKKEQYWALIRDGTGLVNFSEAPLILYKNMKIPSV